MIKTILSIFKQEKNYDKLTHLYDYEFDYNPYFTNIQELEEFFNCDRGSMEIINNVRKYKVSKEIKNGIKVSFVVFTDDQDNILLYNIGDNDKDSHSYSENYATMVGNLIVFSITDCYGNAIGIINTEKAICIGGKGIELAYV